MDLKGKPLFYFEGELAGSITLSEEESRHCALSLRMKVGDSILLTNGLGFFAEGNFTRLHPKASKITILHTVFVKNNSSYRRLCIAPPKTSERFEWMIEKVIEIGVDEIVFLETQNSERNKLNLERVNKIAVAAIKQSKQARLPKTIGLIKWKQFLDMEFHGSKYIAHVSLDNSTSNLALEIVNGSTENTILIGPEGDFTNEEIKSATNLGYKAVSLGNNVLRTETAAVYALTIFNAFV